MKIGRSSRFDRLTRKTEFDSHDVQDMIEQGWTAMVVGQGHGANVILTQTISNTITVPMADGREAVEWAAEINRRAEELHTPR